MSAEEGDDVRSEGEHEFYVPRSPAEAPSGMGPPRLALTVSAEHFLCAPRTPGGEGMLRIDKRTYAFAVEAAAAPPEFSHTITVVAILGVIHRRQEAFLAVVTEAVCVGTVCGGRVFGVRGAALLPFELQASVAQLSRSEAVTREVRSIERALSRGGFYLSYDVDLSGPLSTLALPSSEAGTPDAKYSDEYCWNREMSEELRALPPPYSGEWVASLIHGSVQAEQIWLGSDAALPPPLRNKSASVALVARRSRLRSSPRGMVGLDEEGSSAGLVSTHLLLGVDSGEHAPPAVCSLQVVWGSCPLMWERAGERLCIQPEASCRDSLLRHVRQVGPKITGAKEAGKDAEHHCVTLVSVHTTDAPTTDDLALERRLDTAVALAASMLQQEAEGRGKPSLLTKVAAKFKATPAWGDLEAPGRGGSAIMEKLRACLQEAGDGKGPRCAVDRGGLVDGLNEREQHVVWRLHAAHASTDEATHILSLGCVALAMGLIGLENLFSEARAGAKVTTRCGAELQEALARLWQHAGANLYRQVSQQEPPSEEQPVAKSGTASKLSGLTGGRASSLFRRVAAGVSAATQVISSLAGASAPEMQGVELLAHSRGAPSLETRRRWRRHGRICAVEDELWELRPVRIMCGTWNTKGKVLTSAAFRGWFRAALDRWGEAGAEIYAIGLQEGVELGAVNLLRDAGNVFAETLNEDETDEHAAHGDDSPNVAGGKALLAWQAEITTAINKAFGEQRRVEVVASRQLVGVMMFVLVDSSIRKLVTNVAVEACRTGLGGMTGNKGAIAVRLQLAHTSIAFVNVHMCAHTKNVAQRNSEYQIIGNMAFCAPSDTPTYPERMQEALKQQRTAPPAQLLAQDVVVYMGDLNYRLDEKVGQDEEVKRRIARGDLEHLKNFDQLLRERRASKVLWGMHEAPLSFAPTYKFCSDSEEYSDGGKGRVPAWTDRILFRGRGVQCLEYTSCMDVRGSDHKPVVALLQLDAKLCARAEASKVLLQQLQQEQFHLVRLAQQASFPPSHSGAAADGFDRLALKSTPPVSASTSTPLAPVHVAAPPATSTPAPPPAPVSAGNLIDLNFEDCWGSNKTEEAAKVKASGPGHEAFLNGGLGASSNGFDSWDPFEDAVPPVAPAHGAGGGGVGVGGKSGIMDDLFGLDFSALPPTPEQMNIAADLGLSAPPLASVSSSGVGAARKADESLRSSMAALMADRLIADSHSGKAKTAPQPTTTSQAGGQKKDPFDGLFQ